MEISNGSNLVRITTRINLFCATVQHPLDIRVQNEFQNLRDQSIKNLQGLTQAEHVAHLSILT